MSRPQFSLRTIFWLTALVAVACVAVPPLLTDRVTVYGAIAYGLANAVLAGVNCWYIGNLLSGRK